MHPLICEEQKKQLKKVPEIRTGYTVRVSQRITEGTKERIQNFEGLVIKVGHGEGAEATFTVRKIVEGIGVEKIYPLHSPNIKKIVVIKKAKVRRSKLYYMRERSGKSARLTERHVTDEERATEEAKMEVLIDEAVKAEEKRKKEDMPESSTDRTDEVTEDSAESVTANPPAEGIEAETEERTESAPVESEAPAEPEAEPEKTEEAPVEEAPVEETPAEEKEEKKDEAEAA